MFRLHGLGGGYFPRPFYNIQDSPFVIIEIPVVRCKNKHKNMKKYFITIVDNKTLTTKNLVRNDDFINSTIDKELGGWANLRSASTSNNEINSYNYQQAGTTKDNKKSYSILCIEVEE